MYINEVSLSVKISVNLPTALSAEMYLAEELTFDLRHQIPSGLRLYAGIRRLTVLWMEGQPILLVKILTRSRVTPNLIDSLIDLT
jgi:hypothetical protein